MLREVARVLADDLGKRVIIVDTSNEIAGDGDIPHPGIGDARRMQVRTPTEQHARDDRGGREPHARGHRHRRDRDRARGRRGAHDRRARRPAGRHGARQHARQPHAQPDPLRPRRRDPAGHPRRRGGAAARDAEDGPRAQGAADVRRAGRDRRARQRHRPPQRRRDGRRHPARPHGPARGALPRRGRRAEGADEVRLPHQRDAERHPDLRAARADRRVRRLRPRPRRRWRRRRRYERGLRPLPGGDGGRSAGGWSSSAWPAAHAAGRAHLRQHILAAAGRGAQRAPRARAGDGRDGREAAVEPADRRRAPGRRARAGRIGR